MKSHSWIHLALVVTLWLGTAIVTDAQTGWPTKRAVRTVQPSEPVKARKANTSATRRTSDRAPKRTRTSKEADLLRTMAELVTRQAAAIEALARRLEAAESRLDLMANASTPGAPVYAQASIEPIDDPFRAARSVDWAEVISGTFGTF